jgi:type IX secretion system PorP/SprF family membrane protein
MRYLRHWVCLVLLVLSEQLLAQQEAQYTQYMYNTMSINPAYVGSRAEASINLLYRSQWSGLDGAPTSQTLNIGVPTSERVSLGLSVLYDEVGNGTNQEPTFGGVFAYSLLFGNNARLSLGLRAGGNILNIDYNNLRNLGLGVPNDLANIDKKFSPNVGLGAFYSSGSFYAGLSVPDILETEHFGNGSDDGSFVSRDRMHYYLMTGYVFELNPRLIFKPATLLRATSGSSTTLDLSANFLFNEKFRLGASYRFGASISGLFGLEISEKLLIGLAYDKDTNGLGGVLGNDGSFEVFLRYRFKSKRNYVSPMFF